MKVFSFLLKRNIVQIDQDFRTIKNVMLTYWNEINLVDYFIKTVFFIELLSSTV